MSRIPTGLRAVVRILRIRALWSGRRVRHIGSGPVFGEFRLCLVPVAGIPSGRGRRAYASGRLQKGFLAYLPLLPPCLFPFGAHEYGRGIRQESLRCGHRGSIRRSVRHSQIPHLFVRSRGNRLLSADHGTRKEAHTEAFSRKFLLHAPASGVFGSCLQCVFRGDAPRYHETVTGNLPRHVFGNTGLLRSIHVRKPLCQSACRMEDLCHQYGTVNSSGRTLRTACIPSPRRYTDFRLPFCRSRLLGSDGLRRSRDPNPSDTQDRSVVRERSHSGVIRLPYAQIREFPARGFLSFSRNF